MRREAKVLLTACILSMGVLYASDIIATVDSVKITKDDANRFIQASQPTMNYDMLDAKQKKQVIDRLIERELFSQEAKRAGIEKDPEFIQLLQQQKKDLMVAQWMKNDFEKTIVSDGEVKEFYNKNKKKFEVPAQVHARHILVKSEKKAQEIIDQLKGLKGDKLKAKFIELAKKESQGPTGVKGGDLGYFTASQMVLPFSKAAFSLKKGEITTKPVKTQFGYHVIYVEDVKPAQILPFDVVKDKIRQSLKEKEFREKMQLKASELKKRAKITTELDNK